MREKLFVSLLCLALVMALSPARAQDEADGAGQAQDAGAPPAPQQNSGGDAAPPSSQQSGSAPKGGTAKSGIPAPGNLPGTAKSLFAMIIGFVSHIGGLFGIAPGMRIGGTSVSAIAMLVIAKLIQDKAPDWLRYVLYIGGGTMFAGSGANITQLIMQNITF